MSIDRTTTYRRAGLPADAGEERATGEEAQSTPDQGEADRFAAFMRRPAPGEAILAGLGAGPPREAGPAAQLVGELAERLLVGDESGPPTVRAVAKDVGIPGLEVVVRRDGGRLVVELLAELTADLSLLRAHAGDLARHLEGRFGVPAEIMVRRRDAPAAPQGQDPGP